MKRNIIEDLNIAKIEQYILHPEINISTATITCETNVIFNVEKIGLEFNDFDEIIYGKKYGDRIDGYMVNVKNIEKINKKTKNKKPKKEKKNFFNQVSILFSSHKLLNKHYNNKNNDETKKINVKLFKNGSIQMTGCRDLNNIDKCLNILFERLKKNKDFVDDINKLTLENVYNFKIVMMNANFNCMFLINRNMLFKILLDNNYEVYFDPIVRPPVSIKYKLKYNPSKQTSIFVFESGAINITGCNNYLEILESYNFINSIIYKNYSVLSKKIMNSHIIIKLINEMT